MTQNGGAVSPKVTSTMTARGYFLANCLGFAAWCWCTAGALAQERPATPQSEGAGPPAEVAGLSDFPWHTVEWVERRYKIEAMRSAGDTTPHQS